MAFNNGFPIGYPQQVYPNYQQLSMFQQTPTQSQSNTNRIWVQGINGAKSYLTAPNTCVDLWDSENKTIYIKSADNNGIPTIKILDYSIREEAKESESRNNVDYATKDELRDLREEIRTLKERLETRNRPNRKEGVRNEQ